eukprot:gnl/TRDRNA2_/TRDRNA2_160014_c0_seq2.p1 gnl/TRDRNA2_/TRDRNA2_160014_c0~~gnl/TRDRNA2_/TRDRNA2_160014_c0_seq2.p1  ORF type:complete len:440 (+),score=83.89 gnl/TRDRNA2_/TRDRNA2_160014_c0_seq2:64-1320(+)
MARVGNEPELAQTETLLALQPVVTMLSCDKCDGISGGRHWQAQHHKGTVVPLPTPEKAQRMKPMLLRGLLNADEIALVRALGRDHCATEVRDHIPATSNQWRTRYLSAGGRFYREAPQLREKLVEALLRADASADGWGLLSGIGPERMAFLQPRCVEYHRVLPGGSLPDPTHIDGGSVITIDVMLSDPSGGDFTGGEFCTLESDGRYAQHTFGQGDAVVFVSHKYHCIRPLLSGLREVLIMEFWEGDERHCDHRCEQRWGPCALHAEEEQERELEREKKKEQGAEKTGETEKAEEDEPEDSAARVELEKMIMQAGEAFAASAFEGQVFYTRIGGILAQSETLGAAARARGSANVEIAFESATPIATVRALRDIKAGEILVAKQYDGGTDSESMDESIEETSVESGEDEVDMDGSYCEG